MRCEIRAVAVAAGLTLLVAGPAGGQIMSTGEGKLAYFELHGPVLEKPVDPMATLFVAASVLMWSFAVGCSRRENRPPRGGTSGSRVYRCTAVDGPMGTTENRCCNLRTRH